MPPQTLPAHAKQIYLAVEASAEKGTCKNAGARKEECIARVAWGAVKKVYKQVDGKWVKKSEAEIAAEYRALLSAGERQKSSKKEAGFMEKAGVSGLQCGDCQQFSSPSSCLIVEGFINTHDYCNQFGPLLSRGDVSAVFAGAMAEMIITKAARDPKTGEMRWAAVASDTDKDALEEGMSLELFNDFIQRAENGDPVPNEFASEAWNGGMPYLGLSHYLDLDGEGILGPTKTLYIDGNRLKAKGIFKDTPLGRASFAAIRKDRAEDIPYDQRVRISIAFLDWEHAHKVNEFSFVFQRRSLEDLCPLCAVGVHDKIYKKGHLIHLALTRVPVNQRASIWLEERAMLTRKEDGINVLGVEHTDLVEYLEGLDEKKRSAIKKSLADGVIIVKAKDGEEHSATLEELAVLLEPIINDRVEKEVKRSVAAIKIQEKSEEGAAMEKPEGQAGGIAAPVEPVVVPAAVPAAAPVTKPVAEPVAELSALDDALAKLKSAVENAETQVDVPIEERFKAIQPAINSVAEVVKATIIGEKNLQAQAMAEIIAGALREELKPLTDAVQLAVKKSSVPPPPDDSMIPAPRAFTPRAIFESGEEQPKSQITQLARRSVGLKN